MSSAATNQSAAKPLTRRVVAVRSELSALERSARPNVAMVKALKKDLFTLETRLEAVL